MKLYSNSVNSCIYWKFSNFTILNSMDINVVYIITAHVNNSVVSYISLLYFLFIYFLFILFIISTHFYNCYVLINQCSAGRFSSWGEGDCDYKFVVSPLTLGKDLEPAQQLSIILGWLQVVVVLPAVSS